MVKIDIIVFEIVGGGGVMSGYPQRMAYLLLRQVLLNSNINYNVYLNSNNQKSLIA